MEKILIPSDWDSNSKPTIKIIGVGGGGGNTVNHLHTIEIKDVELIISNTDRQVLKQSPVPHKIQLGINVTSGLGTGCDPKAGKKAALESIDEIRSSLGKETKMLFITAGMGGGTGTGASPVIAKIAREMGILTVAVVTLPFRDEGREVIKRALRGIKELEKNVDSLLMIDNQKIYENYPNLPLPEAFPKIDEILSNAVKKISDIITIPGLINVDFADVDRVMRRGGITLMGSGTAHGENRITEVVDQTLTSPLLNDYNLDSAQKMLINIVTGPEETLTGTDISKMMKLIAEYMGGHDPNFKRGFRVDPQLGNAISLTIIATGLTTNTIHRIASSEELSDLLEDYQKEEEVGIFAQESYEIGSEGERRPTLLVSTTEEINRYNDEPAYIRKERNSENKS
ncbi:MAG: cell division protein FtsZ [Bacteroidales bacterium]